MGTQEKRKDTIGRKISNKCTKIVYEERISKISMLILMGVQLPEIKRLVNANSKKDDLNWDVTERQVENYYNIAYKRIALIPSKEEIHGYLGLTINRYNQLYKSCTQIKDFKTCVQINKNISDLLSLPDYTKEILDIKTVDGQTVYISFNNIKNADGEDA